MESLHVANDASRSLTAIRRTLGADPREQFYVVGTERRLHERAFPAPTAGINGAKQGLWLRARPGSAAL